MSVSVTVWRGFVSMSLSVWRTVSSHRVSSDCNSTPPWNFLELNLSDDPSLTENPRAWGKKKISPQCGCHVLWRERLMRSDGTITRVLVCVCVCARFQKAFFLFLPFLSSLHRLRLSASLSPFMSDACLPITLSTESNKHCSYKSTNIIASTVEKKTAAAVFVTLRLVMTHYNPHFPCGSVIDRTVVFSLLVSEIFKSGILDDCSTSLCIITLPIKQVFWLESWTVTQGKVRLPSHYDIQKVIHKSSPDGYCATRKAEQEPEEEQGKLLEKDVAPKGLGGGGGIRKKKRRWQ